MFSWRVVVAAGYCQIHANRLIDSEPCSLGTPVLAYCYEAPLKEGLIVAIAVAFKRLSSMWKSGSIR
jgi:hypothetical protein